MSVQIKLKDMVDELEVQLDDFHSFLNVKTGQIVGVTSEDLQAAEDEEPFEHLVEWQQDDRRTAKDIVENDEDYMEFPTKYEINEYQIIEEFCYSISDERKQEALLRAIRGRGAFRRFKDTIIEFGIEDQWYVYRNEILKQIAIKWCQENDINYIE